MRCVGGERTTPMDVVTREGELRSPRLPFVLLRRSPIVHHFSSILHFTYPRLRLLMRCVGDERDGTTPMDVGTHPATEGELPSPHPLCA